MVHSFNFSALLIGSDWISVSIHNKRQLSTWRLSSYERHVHLYRQHHSRRLRTCVAMAGKSSWWRIFVLGSGDFEMLRFQINIVNHPVLHIVRLEVQTLNVVMNHPIIMSLFHPATGTRTGQWRILKLKSCCRSKHAARQRLRHRCQLGDSGSL